MDDTSDTCPSTQVLSFVFQMRVSSLEHLGSALRERIGKLQESINGGKKKNPLFVVLPALELLWLKMRYRAHWQLKFSFLSRSSKFQAAILFIVVANTAIVILSAVGIIGVEVSSMLNYLFMIIFIVECIIKILGLGFAGYFVDPWNKVSLRSGLWIRRGKCGWQRGGSAIPVRINALTCRGNWSKRKTGMRRLGSIFLLSISPRISPPPRVHEPNQFDFFIIVFSVAMEFLFTAPAQSGAVTLENASFVNISMSAGDSGDLTKTARLARLVKIGNLARVSRGIRALRMMSVIMKVFGRLNIIATTLFGVAKNLTSVVGVLIMIT